MFTNLADFDFSRWETGGGRDTSICERKPYIFKGDKSCTKNTSVYVACLVLFIILEDLMLYVVCSTISRCGQQPVKAS